MQKNKVYRVDIELNRVKKRDEWLDEKQNELCVRSENECYLIKVRFDEKEIEKQ